MPRRIGFGDSLRRYLEGRLSSWSRTRPAPVVPEVQIEVSQDKMFPGGLPQPAAKRQERIDLLLGASVASKTERVVYMEIPISRYSVGHLHIAGHLIATSKTSSNSIGKNDAKWRDVVSWDRGGVVIRTGRALSQATRSSRNHCCARSGPLKVAGAISISQLRAVDISRTASCSGSTWYGCHRELRASVQPLARMAAGAS